MTTTDPGSSIHRARWWHPEGDACRCSLCPHHCLVLEGTLGFCNARGNVDGMLVTFTYGQICASMVDPVEKKPVFHFQPGARLFSVGTFGCNLDCGFCQNAMLARAAINEVPSKYMSPEELVTTALEKKVDGIGWTFNDPIVWSEYVIDVSILARKQGLFTLINTNGFIESEAREDLLEHVDVAKVDIKGFDEETYRDLCHGELAPVLETCVRVYDKGIHLELAYPVIPGRTDDPDSLARLADWVLRELDQDVPIHLFRFQPAYRLSHLNSPDMPRLHECRRMLLEAGMRFVYLGGVTGADQDTICPSCGTTVVRRHSEEAEEKVFIRKEAVSRFCPTYSKVQDLSVDGYCPECGESLRIRKKKHTGQD
jgi:pyruvate formate lyase activating enzyme